MELHRRCSVRRRRDHRRFLDDRTECGLLGQETFIQLGPDLCGIEAAPLEHEFLTAIPELRVPALEQASPMSFVARPVGGRVTHPPASGRKDAVDVARAGVTEGLRGAIREPDVSLAANQGLRRVLDPLPEPLGIEGPRASIREAVSTA